jgi:hypothetical protein
MPPVRNISQSADKFVRRAQAATQDYQAGIQSPRAPWQESTSAAAPVYQAAMAESLAQNRYQKGVNASSNSEWSTAAITKGAPRFAPGVAAAKDKWQRKFQPYANVIQGVTLSPRGPKGSPQNLQRVADIANALHAAKVGT